TRSTRYGSPTTAKQGWLISTETAATGVGRGAGQILYLHIGCDRANGTGFGGDYGPLPPACAVGHGPGRPLGRSRRIRVGQQQPHIAGRGLVQAVYHRDWKLGYAATSCLSGCCPAARRSRRRSTHRNVRSSRVRATWRPAAGVCTTVEPDRRRDGR